MLPSHFPRHLWPLSIHFFQKRLFLGANALTDMARQWGTPLYIYDAATIDHAISAYRHGLRAWPGPGLVTYASKAWLSLPLAQFLARRGLGLDVVSEGEMTIGLRGGFDAAMLHLHGNNKSPQLLQRAVDAGVGAIVVDNLHELALLEALTPPEPLALWLRLNPDLLAPTHAYRQTGHHGSKFGMARAEALTAARRIAASPHLRLTGLHVHIGSQIFDLDALSAAIDRLIDLAAAIEEAGLGQIRALSPGGGLGIPYNPDDPAIPLHTLVKQLCAHAADSWRQRHGGPHPALILEPGRSLVARSGIALYTVGAVRHLEDGRRIIAVDGGMSDNPRPALYGARYTAALARNPLGEAVGPARIVGPLCESGDFLIEEVLLPEVQPGDVLAIPVSGAYQLSMASNYNGSLRPAVILHTPDGLHLMQRREIIDDLVRRDQPLTF
jgi:diaminopimelate decarboxylase